jgi:hypothetical protein
VDDLFRIGVDFFAGARDILPLSLNKPALFGLLGVPWRVL